MNTEKEFEKIQDEIIKLRHTIHENPELSFEEHETTKLIRSFCINCGLYIIDIGMPTGVAAYLDCGCKTTVALRCDIDALSAEPCAFNGYKSAAHNCGHDFHTASLLACVKIMSQNKSAAKNNILFIFQPAEEVTNGAQKMLDCGLLSALPSKPAAVFGIHNRPEIPLGKVAVHKGALMAAKTNFIIDITGKAGHGGQPHECIDPIVCSAAVISAVQTVVSRNTNPLDACVCTICSVHGGTTDNQAPESVRMTGSIRALDKRVIDRCRERLTDITVSTSKAFMCKNVIEFIPQVPPVYNSEKMYDFALKCAQSAFGGDGITDTAPVLGSEDFAVFGEHIPSFFYWVGSGSADRPCTPWHSSNFTVDDDYLLYAAKLYVSLCCTEYNGNT